MGWGEFSWLIAVKLRHKVAGIQLETIMFVELLHVTLLTMSEEPETLPQVLNMTSSMRGMVSPSPQL